MPTKEDIVKKYIGLIGTLDFPEDHWVYRVMDEWAGYLISQRSSITTAYDIPKHILDAFSKQQAVAFMNWTLSNDCHWSCTDEDQWTIATESITTEKLYELFLTRQTENK